MGARDAFWEAKSTALYALGVGFMLLVVTAAAGECPSDDIGDILKDPAVQGALDDAWGDSNEGQPDEHEEGGFILECAKVGPDGEVSYSYEIVRLPSGDRDSIDAPLPSGLPAGCRIVATFHTHPGPEKGHPEEDGYDNNEPSVNDSIWANNHNLPGIIVYGTGPERDEDTNTITYGPRQPQEDCEIPEPKSAETKGDPHLTTFDGLVYSFQAVGEYVAAANEDIEIQVRFEPVPGSTVASNTTAVAVRLGPHVAMVHLDGTLRLDGQVVNALPDRVGGVAIAAADRAIAFSWPDGTTLTVTNWRFLLNVRIESIRFGWEGLFGDGDGDPSNDLVGINGSLDGRVDFAALYNELRPRWAITDAMSLFTYGPGESTASFTNDAFPSSVVAFDDFDDAAVEAARDACKASLVWRSPYLENCMYDFLVTELSDVIEAAAAAHRQQFPIAEIGTIDGTVEVEGSIPVEGAGAFYFIEGTPGTLVSISVDSLRDVEACPRETADFRLALMNMDGEELETAWPGNTGCRAFGPWQFPDDGKAAVFLYSGEPVPSAESVLRTGTFAMTIGAPNGRLEDVSTDLDTSVTVNGSLTTPLDFVDYRLTGDPGDLVSVDVAALDGIEDCGQEIWDMHLTALGDQAEELGTGWPGSEACRPYGGWEIPASGSMTIRIHGGDGSRIRPLVGTYRLEIGRYRLDTVAVDAASGPQVIEGTVDIALDGTTYTVAAAPGSRITATVLSMNGRTGCGGEEWDLVLVVTDGEGNPIGDGWPGASGCGAYGPWTVPDSGMLIVEARGSNYQRFPSTGTYVLEFSQS